VVAREGSMAELEALARAEEQDRVLAWIVATPQRLDPDGAFGPSSGVARSTQDGALVEALSAPLRDSAPEL
jgi:hypothetical protein